MAVGDLFASLAGSMANNSRSGRTVARLQTEATAGLAPIDMWLQIPINSPPEGETRGTGEKFPIGRRKCFGGFVLRRKTRGE